jgi:nucleoside-diphosphate-sugar epimerase
MPFKSLHGAEILNEYGNLRMTKSLTLVSGSTGFLGRAISQKLLQIGQPVVSAVRKLPTLNVQFMDASDVTPNWKVVGSIDSETNWQSALDGVQTVVHCAARVHVSQEHAEVALKAYREVNVAGTLRLAKQASASGVKRFVFISSIGVNGNQSSQPFTESDLPRPHDAYATSKLEAEIALFEIATQTGMEVVIIRPPLVYGPNAPGNFGRLVRWVQSGIPIPLGSVHNQRSFIALDNLVSLVLLCSDRDRSMKAANQVFVVADGEDISTSTLLSKVAQASGQPSRLLPVPPSILRGVATLMGKRALANSLLGNLQVDASKARSLLGWLPVVTLEQQLVSIFANHHK